MTPELHRRIGFEVELLAPPGRSRRTLAEDLAARHGGRIRPVWHHDSEPSLVPGLGRFLHLTQGFEVRRRDDTVLCTLVDDITLLADLNPATPPPPGWFRILSDDHRLLSLLAAHSDPGGALSEALTATAKLWGSEVEQHGDVYRLGDASGATIALAAPQGAERERPCEIVTPPLACSHAAALEELLGPAQELGFTVPQEAAVHMHLDGGDFRHPRALANVVRLFAHWRDPLRALLQTNPACRRLAPLPTQLVEAAHQASPQLADLAAAAEAGGLTKFFDVNLIQLFKAVPLRDTIEIRILPGAIRTDEIMNRAGLIELLLDHCTRQAPFPDPPADPAAGLDGLLEIAAAELASR